jgi:hypothetical protein
MTRSRGAKANVAALAMFALAGGCQYMPELPAMPSFGAPASHGICSGAGLSIDVDFAAAGLHHCVITATGDVVVQVDHEPTLVEGINPSPWFAFRITAQAASTTNLTLDYTDYTHRYVPWISRDGRSWEQLPADSLTLNERKTRATLKLDVRPGQMLVAGQPVSSAADNVSWTRKALSGRDFDEMKYGVSREGRDLIGFAGGGGLEAIVILTRQHPPETSGQDAYRGFVERLVTRNDEKAFAFRGRHRIIIAPMPNPDGVDNGHWRLNTGGIDLNRDWGKFTQPETKALSDWIIAQAATRRVVSMMDFHSTDKTVIYAPPLDSPSPTIGFLPALKQALDSKITPAPGWSYNHNPNGGTSKGWALEALKAPGITVELWDQIPTADARKIGAATADALIEHFSR